MAQTVQNLPAVWETWVWSLGWEDPLATHTSILAWRIPWTEEPGGLQSIASQRVGQDWSDLAHSTQSVFTVRKQKSKGVTLFKVKKVVSGGTRFQAWKFGTVFCALAALQPWGRAGPSHSQANDGWILRAEHEAPCIRLPQSLLCNECFWLHYRKEKLF